MTVEGCTACINGEPHTMQNGRFVHTEQSSIDQPPPVPNETTPIWDLVIADMQERDQVGRKRYGTPLQAGNGRDALVDAYAEALDLVVYLKQAVVERDLRMAETFMVARQAVLPSSAIDVGDL